MPAIAHVDLRLNAATVANAAPAAIGSGPSASLTQDAPTLIVARGQCRNDTGGAASTLELRFAGAVHARSDAQHSVFGTPAYGAVGATQLATFVLVNPGASDEMEWYGSDALSAGSAEAAAFALDLTNIDENDGRWHVQTANSDSIVDTPTSGYEQVGTELVVTAPRSGSYLLLASAEAVVGGGAASTDLVDVFVAQDNVTIDGSSHVSSAGFGGFVRLEVMGYAHAAVVTLTASQEYTFLVAANGTTGGGNIGWRRIRLHLLEVAAFDDADVLSDTDTAGLTVTAGNVTDVSGLSVTCNPPEEVDYLLLASVQGQFSAWPRAFFRIGGASNEPAAGFANAAMGTGVTAADDMTVALGAEVITVDTSTTVGLRCQAAAGGSTSLWGADCAHADAGAIRLVAIRLATPDAGGFVEGSGTDEATADDAGDAQRVRAGAGTDAASSDDAGAGAVLVAARGTREFAPST